MKESRADRERRWLGIALVACLFCLVAVAGAASAPITPEIVDKLKADDFDAYFETVDLLERARQADSLSELFILDPDFRYLATTDFEADSFYFLAALNGPYIDSVLFGEEERAIATPSYPTGDLFLKSAFAPLFDPEGRIAAVIGVEANVDYFDSLGDLKQNLYYSTAISLAGGVLFGLLFLIVQRRLGSLQRQLVMNETHAYLGRMVAVVAHEVRNPLMIIRASAERIGKKHQAPESEFIVEEIDRLNNLVTGYLDFARGSEDSYVAGKSETVDLAGFVGNIKRHIQDKLAGTEIQWTDTPIPPGTSFDTHTSALRQVVLNLLINAAEACQSAKLPVKLGLEISDKPDKLVLTVSDEGPGMAKSQLRQVGDPFFTTKQKGSGLGLFLSRKIVVQMGGSMDIDSKPGEGTKIALTLPRKVNR